MSPLPTMITCPTCSTELCKTYLPVSRILRTLQDIHQQCGEDVGISMYDDTGKKRGISGVRYNKKEKCIVLDVLEDVGS